MKNPPLDVQHSTFINLFKTYRWNELYESVKLTQYYPATSIQNQHDLAVKAMLLVAWWSDSISAKEILRLYPPIIKEPIIHFVLTYAYMCLGDKEKIKLYLSKKPKNYPKWMESYLDIEFCGRSLQFEKQINLMQKLTSKNQYPQDYIKIALLQSLEHQKADITFLQTFLSEINLSEDTNPLSIALCMRCSLINIDDIDTNSFPLLTEKKASILLLRHKCVESLKEFDSLANTKYLDIYSINKWLSLAISLPQAKEYYLQRVNFALNLVPNSLFIQGTIASYAMIFAWLSGDYNLAYGIVTKYNQYKELPRTDFIKNAIVFFNYILHLCVNWQHNRTLYDNKLPNYKELNAFGESHSLSLSNINFFMNTDNFHANSSFIMGIKMYHLSNPSSSYHAACLLEHFKFIKPNTDIMFTIGEIDTRPDEGIWQVHLKKEKNLDEIIDNTVGGYIDFLYENLKDKNLLSVTIQGIPAPNYALEGDKDPKDKEGFLNMIKQVNEKLQELTLEKGWNFLDVYSATVGEDGMSNKQWHIDGYHLQPIFYTEADKWLVKA